MASVIGFGPNGSVESVSQRRGGNAQERARFVDQLIESEILPRLLVAHSAVELPQRHQAEQIDAADAEAFAPLAASLEAHQLLTEVERFLERGVTVEQVFVELLAPAARYLGDQWKADELDFIEVTMGLWRLQEVLRELAARFPPHYAPAANSFSALFAPMPGNQHSFGTAMVEECFSRAGWDTELMIEPNRAELIAKVAERRFDLVGLTVSCDCHIAPLRSLVTAVRNVSRNPKLCLMLGGPVLAGNPRLAVEVGADGTALTAIGALEMADRLVRSPVNAAIA